jgi:hypothetical protein
VELSCGRCGRSTYVPDELVAGRAFRARCPDCDTLLDVPAERPNALDDKDLAWLSAEAKERKAEAPAPPPRVTEQAVAQYERKAGAERRRHGAAIAVAALAAVVAAAGVLVAISARTGVGPFSKRARADRGAAASATFDASGLAARPKVEEPDPTPAPAPAPTAAKPARKKTARLSRSDRKLLDLLARKDDAAVVAPEGDAMDSAAAGLDADAVARTISENRKAFDSCVSRALRLQPSLHLARRATLVVTVQPNGNVTGAFIAEEEVDRTDLGGCLAAAARRMVFPAFDGEATDVSMPLSLSTGL